MQKIKAAHLQTSNPHLAILFWFYNNLDVCQNRLAHLRKLNPGTAIYGLYGGELSGEIEARQRLGHLLDDFYGFPEERTPHWKWQHGDRLIAAWHQERGHSLVWDTVVVVQWDMLILEPVHKIFSMLKPGEVLFSGLRPRSEVAAWWGWVKDDGSETARDMHSFLERIRRDYGYMGDLWCCLFIVVCLPRRFLDLYIKAGPPEEGFLEYKMPTMAALFGIPACTDHPFRPWWASDPSTRNAPASARVLNAVGQDVDVDTVLDEAACPHGQRIFHPYRKPLPPLAEQAIGRMADAKAALAVCRKGNAVMSACHDTQACRICGNPQDNRRHTAREMMNGWRTPFDYIECASCGCVQIAKVPTDLADYYDESYYSLSVRLEQEFADPALQRERGKSVRQLLTLPSLIARRVRHTDMRRPLWALRQLGLSEQSRVLDIGCGAGRLLFLLHLAGWRDLLGVDPFLQADIRYAEGLTVRRASLGDVEGTWDAIMFHHSFEHVPDPLDTLKAVAARLAPKGTCLLRIPVADSEAWRIYGTDWVQLDAPRHLFLLTRRSMDLLAEQAGLKVVRVDYDSYDFQFWGSEQYRNDVPLFDERSYRWGANPVFPPEQIAAWQQAAERLNKAGQGDQAAYYLTHR